MARILLTAALTLAAQKVRKLFPEAEFFLTDRQDMPEQLALNMNYISLGPEQQSSFPHLVLAACLDQDLDTVIPLRLNEIRQLVEAGLLFEEFGIRLLVPAAEELKDPVETAEKDDQPLLAEGRLVFIRSNKTYPFIIRD